MNLMDFYDENYYANKQIVMMLSAILYVAYITTMTLSYFVSWHQLNSSYLEVLYHLTNWSDVNDCVKRVSVAEVRTAGDLVEVRKAVTLEVTLSV